MKYISVLLIGILVGAVGGGGYVYKKLEEANGMLATAKIEAASASKALRERDEELQHVKADLAAAKDELKQAVTARESAEASLKQALIAKDAAEAMAKQAQEAKVAAEKALAEAKKPAAQ